MKSINYKGYQIDARSFHLANGRWDMNVFIRKYRPDRVDERQFFAHDTFTTADEAIQHCLNFGMQIIDGNVANCSVEDL